MTQRAVARISSVDRPLVSSGFARGASHARTCAPARRRAPIPTASKKPRTGRRAAPASRSRTSSRPKVETEAGTPLRVRLLGEIEVWWGTRKVDLPQSKKTRALLAYLVLEERPRRRERLCELLWDVTDDPRGALRWSLSRLRKILEGDGRQRIVADRESVEFVRADAWVDAAAVRERLLTDVADLSDEDLVALAGEFRGEFAEGLELADFHDFQTWCVAERERLRRLHVQLLRTLVDRLADRPEEALPHARRLVHIEPVDESARARLIRLLATTDRWQEVTQQYSSGTRLLDELGAKRSGELHAAWQEVRRRRGTDPDAAAEAPADAESTAPPDAQPALPPVVASTDDRLVGRENERARMAARLDDVTKSRRAHVLLISGEPGIGKSRLLAELRAQVRAKGGVCLDGSAYEIETGRPYGPWIDALRRAPSTQATDADGARLTSLLADLTGESESPPTRERLFGAVVDLVARWCERAPVVLLTLDDVQWSDEASTALLHYVGRMSRERPLLVSLAARGGELVDNTAMSRTLRAFRRDLPVDELRLGPLDPAAVQSLVAELAPQVDPELVYERSGGNPLFALEVARAGPSPEDAALDTLAELVRDRLDRIPLETADLLRWAAVLGLRFGADDLARLSRLSRDAFVAALETLERHSLIRPSETDDPSRGAYAFAHDVVRGVVYGELSEPRRRLMHLRVAEAFQESSGRDDGDESVAGQIAHHAALAGDLAAAARACVTAGRHCLRVFANREALGFARRGLRYAESLEDPERVRFEIDLTEVSLTARRPPELEAAARHVEALAERALEQGCMEHARLGFHLLAYLRWEKGEWSDAHKQMMRAELASRTSDPGKRAEAQAEAARCLAMLERDLGRAEALLLESRAVSRNIGVQPTAVPVGIGMLRMHQGNLDEAARLFEEGRRLALVEGHRQGEFQALEQLVLVELQRERYGEAETLALELSRIAEKLRGGSEAPFARALLALIRYVRHVEGADTILDESIAELRLIDAKHRLAYTLRRAAEVDLARGDAALAKERGEEALKAARVLERRSETAHAHVVLARAASSLNDSLSFEEHVGALSLDTTEGLAAETRHAVEALLETAALAPEA